YEGDVAADIVETLRALGGTHTLEDFAEFAAFETAPISVGYRGYDLVECPPSGQGLGALLNARLLEGFGLRAARPNEADRVHVLAEATKAAYRQRDIYVADPVSMRHSVEDILSDDFIDRLRGQISMDKASPVDAFDMPVHRDTVYVTVVDAEGNAISLINS